MSGLRDELLDLTEKYSLSHEIRWREFLAEQKVYLVVARAYAGSRFVDAIGIGINAADGVELLAAVSSAEETAKLSATKLLIGSGKTGASADQVEAIHQAFPSGDIYFDKQGQTQVINWDEPWPFKGQQEGVKLKDLPQHYIDWIFKAKKEDTLRIKGLDKTWLNKLDAISASKKGNPKSGNKEIA